MRLSELDYEKLTDKQRMDLVVKNVNYGSIGLKKDRKQNTAIMVLGANSSSIKERMLTAIELLKKGYGTHLIVSDDFEPKIKNVEDGNFDIPDVSEDRVHEEQMKMMYEIAEIFQIREEQMLYFSDDLGYFDNKIKLFDRYILVTLLPNVRRALQRFKKVYPHKKFEGCATIRDFAEWDLKIEDTKSKYSRQILKEAQNLIEFTKKGYLADMNVDFIFEEEKKK